MSIVITGASGNVGRPLVAELVAAGAQVRAVTRSPETAHFPSGVEVVASAAEALPGASAVVTTDVEKILGRPATTFADWVSLHRNLFAD